MESLLPAYPTDVCGIVTPEKLQPPSERIRVGRISQTRRTPLKKDRDRIYAAVVDIRNPVPNLIPPKTVYIISVILQDQNQPSQKPASRHFDCVIRTSLLSTALPFFSSFFPSFPSLFARLGNISEVSKISRWSTSMDTRKSKRIVDGLPVCVIQLRIPRFSDTASLRERGTWLECRTIGCLMGTYGLKMVRRSDKKRARDGGEDGDRDVDKAYREAGKEPAQAVVATKSDIGSCSVFCTNHEAASASDSIQGSASLFSGLMPKRPEQSKILHN